MIQNLKVIIESLLCCLMNLCINPSKELNEKSLLIIRLDAIGDYVLFRNYIKEIRGSSKYKNYSITLLGNSVWRSISEELDREDIDNFIWIDKSKFMTNLLYRYKKLKEITSHAYEVVLSSVHSRYFHVEDNIVKLITAKEKIGRTGALSNIKKWQKNISDCYYDKLIDTNTDLMFEFDRNKEFFESLLETKIDIKKPHIFLKPISLSFDLPQNYATLFIGGSAHLKKWDMHHFAKIGKYLKEKYKYSIVLCGGSGDVKNAKKFAKYFKSEYLDLVGKTSMIDLFHVIYNESLMISNETSAPHLAIALKRINVFVIYSGNYYGRFTPYPKEISEGYHVVCHPEIEKDFEGYKKLSNSCGYESCLDINEITVESVIKRIEDVLDL